MSAVLSNPLTSSSLLTRTSSSRRPSISSPNPIISLQTRITPTSSRGHSLGQFHACQASVSYTPCSGRARSIVPLPASFLSGDLLSAQALSASVSCTLARSPCRKESFSVRASDGTEKSMIFGAFPPMQTKPAWYWRILAFIPYIMPVSELWIYCTTAQTLHGFFMTYRYLAQPVLEAISRLPGWFGIAYFLTAYLGIVRNKSWPHFFRFHVLTAMLLEILLQVTGMMNDWVPSSVYWGKFGAHFWVAAGFAYIMTVIECMWCALCGTYADAPFLSDAAYLQLTFEG